MDAAPGNIACFIDRFVYISPHVPRIIQLVCDWLNLADSASIPFEKTTTGPFPFLPIFRT